MTMRSLSLLSLSLSPVAPLIPLSSQCSRLQSYLLQTPAPLDAAAPPPPTQILTRPARLCFWKTLIEEYARLQTYRPSCRLHRMCVPAVKELEYLGHYEVPLPAPQCLVHKQVREWELVTPIVAQELHC